MDEEILEKIKIIAIKEKRSVSSILEGLLNDYIKKQSKND